MYTSLQYTTMTHPIEEQKTGLTNDNTKPNNHHTNLDSAEPLT
jgi:hypothetical protein